MCPTKKVSTLRSKGFSIINCRGNTCRIASAEPFWYGEKAIEVKSSQGDYRLELRGHYSKELPKEITK